MMSLPTSLNLLANSTFGTKSLLDLSKFFLNTYFISFLENLFDFTTPYSMKCKVEKHQLKRTQHMEDVDTIFFFASNLCQKKLKHCLPDHSYF